MKKIILILICLFLVLMPSIPKVFATGDESKIYQGFQNEPGLEPDLTAGGYGGGFRGGPYGGPIYRPAPRVYYPHYHNGPRVFACAPVPPPLY